VGMGRRHYMPSDLLCERIPEDLFCNAKVLGVRSPKSLSSISRAVVSPAMSERSPHIFARLFSARALNISCCS
jgi:hypothetical protein